MSSCYCSVTRLCYTGAQGWPGSCIGVDWQLTVLVTVLQVQPAAAGAARLDSRQVAEGAESALGRGCDHGAALHILTDQEGCHQPIQEGPADCLPPGGWCPHVFRGLGLAPNPFLRCAQTVVFWVLAVACVCHPPDLFDAVETAS